MIIIPETKEQQEYDQRLKAILKNLDPTLCRDLRIHNTGKIKYDKFGNIAKLKIDELTAVNDRRHTEGNTEIGEVVVNFAVVISAPDLYKQWGRGKKKWFK